MSARIWALTTLSCAAIVIAACGVPQSSELENVRADDPFGLALPTTTSTTTTSTTTTIVPTTAASPTSSSPAPETTEAIVSETAKLYFVANDKLFPLEVTVLANATTSLILDQLLQGVPKTVEAADSLQTFLPEGSVRDLPPQGGIGTLEVTTEFLTFLATLTPGEQSLAWGQLVLTALRGDPIGQVAFTSDGAPIPVLNGSGETSQPGEPMSVDDYADLRADDR